MKINCLHCGHGFGVDDSYSDYEGLLRCGTCGGLLDTRIEDGMIKSVRPGSMEMQPIAQSPRQHAEPYYAPAFNAPAPFQFHATPEITSIRPPDMNPTTIEAPLAAERDAADKDAA